MNSKNELDVIKKSRNLVKIVYVLCNEKLPAKEQYGMWSQMTRAAVSVPSNLAEGQQRLGDDFKRLVRIARGSLKELETQVQVCIDIGYCSSDDCKVIFDEIDEIGKMTHGLMLRLKSDAEASGSKAI